MSILHVVLFKWKKGTPQAAIDQMLNTLETFAAIPCVEWLHTGESFTGERSLGFTHILVSRLKDRDGVAVFRDHPLHQNALPALRAILEQGLVFDCDEREDQKARAISAKL